jgi:hypothetical protein
MSQCHLRHHDFQSLLNDPRLGDQARADIKWVHEQGATDAVNVQVVEDFATPLGDPLLQHSVLEGPKRIGGLLEKVDDVFRSPTMNKSQERDSDLPVNDGLVSLYPQTLDIIHDSIEKRSDRFGTQGDPTQYRPYLSLVIVQSSPGALIEFLPPEGTAEFVSAVHIYDQSDDTLQDKVARIIFNFEKWREFFCPSGRAERRLDMTPMTTIDENSIIGTSSSVSNGVEDDIGKANQRISSARSVLDEVAVSVAADGPDDFETRSIESSTGLSRYLKKEPSSSEILSAYISFAQHTGLTEAATGSSSSSGSKSASQGNNSRTPQTSQTTISSRKRGRDGDDDSTGWHEGTKRSRNSGSSDHDANEGCIFICPFFSFSLIMRYGCACSSRSFKSINSLRSGDFSLAFFLFHSGIITRCHSLQRNMHSQEGPQA